MTDDEKASAFARWNHDTSRSTAGMWDAFMAGVAAAEEHLRDELEAVNIVAREYGYGQGELDDDLSGCLRKALTVTQDDIRDLASKRRRKCHPQRSTVAIPDQR